MADLIAQSKGTPPRTPDGSYVSQRWVEVRPGEYCEEVVIRDGGISITVDGAVAVSSLAVAQLFANAALLAAGAVVESAWIDVSSIEALFILRKSTGGAYAFEIDWSRDGVAVDIVEVVATTNNGGIKKEIGVKFARFRVRNTDAVTAFTNHLTVVNGR